MKRLAIITARGGSKRIPFKNIKHFCGKPIMQFSIEAAFQTNLFDKIMVSTDNEEIASIALSCNADVPFFRSAETSDDYSTLADVLVEVLNEYEKMGETFDQVCCLLPTAPFIKASNIIKGFEILDNNNNVTSVFPVAKFSYPIQRGLKFNEDNLTVSMIWPEHLRTRSQDLTPAYHDCGQFYCLSVDGLKKDRAVFTSQSSVVELSSMEMQDIDTVEDWEIAELKYRLINGAEISKTN